MTASVLKQDQTQKGSNERLFILTRTHSIHIFREIPFSNITLELCATVESGSSHVHQSWSVLTTCTPKLDKRSERVQHKPAGSEENSRVCYIDYCPVQAMKSRTVNKYISERTT